MVLSAELEGMSFLIDSGMTQCSVAKPLFNNFSLAVWLLRSRLAWVAL